MKIFTREDITRLKMRNYEGMSPEECEQVLSFITGSGGEFMYEVEPELQKEIDELAKEMTDVTERERWASEEEARKAYAWHILLHTF